MICGRCGALLFPQNKSGFCFRHLANEQRDNRRRFMRSLLHRTCSSCGRPLRRLHPKIELCTACYRAVRLDGHYPKAAILRVLHVYQQRTCWWCGVFLSDAEAIGHHIYPFTMIPDNSNADENCGAVHERCHKEIHSNFTMEDYVQQVNMA